MKKKSNFLSIINYLFGQKLSRREIAINRLTLFIVFLPSGVVGYEIFKFMGVRDFDSPANLNDGIIFVLYFTLYLFIAFTVGHYISSMLLNFYDYMKNKFKNY